MPRSNHLATTILRWPITWATVSWLAFYGLIRSGVLSNEFTVRYFDSHIVTRSTMAAFFVAAAALILKCIDIFSQPVEVDKDLLGAKTEDGLSVDEARTMFEQLELRPEEEKQTYVFKRIQDAIGHISRSGSADRLQDHLHHLSDLDASRVHSSYGLLRIVLWAIPILGFLGTVIGITGAIGGMTPDDITAGSKTMIGALKLAFDTTTLSLALSIPLMFIKHLVEQMEFGRLETIDRNVENELIGRFQIEGTNTDPNVAAVRRIGEKVVHVTGQIVERQAELWKSTVDAAHEHWSRLSTNTLTQTEQTLTAALKNATSHLAKELTATQTALDQQYQQRWAKLQATINQQCESLGQQQKHMVQQGEVLLRVIDATGNVTKLEDALNHNLEALANSANFQETVTSLAAAIQLLSAKLGSSIGDPLRIDLQPKKSTGQAA